LLEKNISFFSFILLICSVFNFITAIEAGKNPELCRLPAPIESRRKTDSGGDGTVERPNSLAITPRPRPTKNTKKVTLSSPSSGSESPGGIRRFHDAVTPSSGDSYTTPSTTRHQTLVQKQNTSQALVPLVQGTTYSTNPYSDGLHRLNPGLYPLSNVAARSPNIPLRSHQRNQIHGSTSPLRGSPAATVPEEPSPFDQVKFPPPSNHNKLPPEGYQPMAGKKSVRFTPHTGPISGNRTSYQTQRSLLDENMGEEKDIHDPLLSTKPRQEQSKTDHKQASKEAEPAYDYAELEREFLT